MCNSASFHVDDNERKEFVLKPFYFRQIRAAFVAVRKRGSHVEKSLAATRHFRARPMSWQERNLKGAMYFRRAIVESAVQSSRELLGAKAPLYGRFFKGDAGHFYVLARWYVMLRPSRRNSLAEPGNLPGTTSEPRSKDVPTVASRNFREPINPDDLLNATRVARRS